MDWTQIALTAFALFGAKEAVVFAYLRLFAKKDKAVVDNTSITLAEINDDADFRREIIKEYKEIRTELTATQTNLMQISQENADLKASNKILTKENIKLEQEVKELRDSLHVTQLELSDAKGKIETLIAIMESKK